MAEFQMKVRNMKTGETLVASAASYDEAAQFLRERPPFMEILGVLSDVSPKEMRELQEAMRPYDPDEQAFKRESDLRRADEAAAALERGQEQMAQLDQASRKETESADPNRPLSIRWEVDEGMVVVDAHDQREITPAAAAAVEAWIKERNSWIEGRGQFVAEAHLQVYPGPVPGDDESKRILEGGTFVPRLVS